MVDLRIIFMGTPELACPSLQVLRDSPGFLLVGVVTQPDRPKGRDLKLQASPVKELALGMGLPVLQPERARDEAFLQDVRGLQPDLIAVTAYGQILPRALLDTPRYGCLNVHTSLLPKYRGAAPIQWALLNDERETGVTIMRMDAGLDTGDMLTQESTPISETDTSVTLHERLSNMGAQLLARTIPGYISGTIVPKPQPEGVSMAPKIKKEHGRLDWTQPARQLWNRVRALTPWPGAFTFFPGLPQPHLLKVWHAELSAGTGKPGEILAADKRGLVVSCGQDALRILSLQREGGRRLTPEQFLAGHPLMRGTCLG
jgi:methionyl-tRNA formyltransferase